MTTIASPIAATAMTDASTATWLMFEAVRNCGAAIDTRPPSARMIATRLNSRWRASEDNHWFGVAPRRAVAPDSAMGPNARPRGLCRVGVGGGTPGGREH